VRKIVFEKGAFPNYCNCAFCPVASNIQGDMFEIDSYLHEGIERKMNEDSTP